MLVAVPLNSVDAIVLDGELDEPIWQRAAPATDFLQQDPANGAPATERTEVRIVFDRQRLYLGVQCFDSEPAGILGKQMLRDADLSRYSVLTVDINPWRRSRQVVALA